MIRAAFHSVGKIFKKWGPLNGILEKNYSHASFLRYNCVCVFTYITPDCWSLEFTRGVSGSVHAQGGGDYTRARMTRGEDHLESS